MSNHTVMIIDEHPIFRFGLSHLLTSKAEFEISAEVTNSKEALNIATTKQPNMILIDTILQGNKTFETIIALIATSLYFPSQQ